MAKKQDKAREDRIMMEIVVDAYGPEEQAMGWHCYLDNNLTPFTANCTKERAITPAHQHYAAVAFCSGQPNRQTAGFFMVLSPYRLNSTADSNIQNRKLLDCNDLSIDVHNVATPRPLPHHPRQIKFPISEGPTGAIFQGADEFPLIR